MDANVLIFVILPSAPLVLPLLYVLTILLRVACHFAGVEIPALGRAFFTASVTAILSMAAALFVNSHFGVTDSAFSVPGFFSLFLTLVLSLFANMILATVLYRLFLSITYNKAITVWLIQALSFAAFAVAASCLIGVVRMLLFQ